MPAIPARKSAPSCGQRATPPRQTSGTARTVLWTIVRRRLRQQTAFCYGQEHDTRARLLPLREVQEQYGGLYHALYPRGNTETVCAAPDKSSGHRRQKIQIIWNFVGEPKQDGDEQTTPRQRKSRTAQQFAILSCKTGLLPDRCAAKVFAPFMSYLTFLAEVRQPQACRRLAFPFPAYAG